ncbi:MAG: serine/threonine-protein kinase [Myxococcota bacterium]
MDAGSRDGDQGKTLVDSMTDNVPDEDALAEARLERGTSVDRYVVLYELGSGGMGVVYAAYDPELDRKVALKLLHANSRSSRARTRLLREAKAIARISHPNVVTVHDVGTFEGRVFVAMEYIEGQTFRRWMQSSERAWGDVMAVLSRAGEGLAAAHQGDLIHRDFKPDNILVEDGGRAVVLDFGLARRTSSRDDLPIAPSVDPSAPSSSAETEVELTRTGAKLGTPAYMAPEQHLSGPTDARTDQFSFCVVLWEALYGARPFLGSTAREARYAVLKGHLTEPRDGDVPVAIRRVLTRGLSIDPEARYGDMRSLLSALSRGPRGRVPMRVGMATLAVVGVGVGTLAFASEGVGASPCEDASVRWDGVWDDGVRDRVRGAFLGSGAKFAGAAWDGVEATLQRYTDGWADAHRDACEATHVHKEQSDATLELRMGCLRARHQAVEALVREFSDADASVVENAIEAVNSLPRLHDCSDTQRLRTDQPSPTAPVDIRYTAPLRDALVDARAKESSARYAQALAIVQRVLGDAEALGADDIVAEAHLQAGSILERRSEFERAERSFLEAIWAAERAEHRLVEAKAWVRLVWVTGVERFEPERGHLWAEFATAALRRAGGGAVLEARLRHNVGGVLYTQKRFDEALAEYRLALAQQTDLLGEDDPQVAATLNHIGNALMESRRYSESKSSCERSLAIRRRLFGDQHPKVAASLNNLAELARKQELAEDALARAEESLAILGRSGTRDEDVASMIAGWALRELDRPQDAVRRFERALAMRKETDGPFAPRVVDVELELARTQAALGDADGALEQLERVIELETGRRVEVLAKARALRARLSLEAEATAAVDG